MWEREKNVQQVIFTHGSQYKGSLGCLSSYYESRRGFLGAGGTLGRLEEKKPQP